MGAGRRCHTGQRTREGGNGTRMENTLYARMREWEVWVGKFQFDQWDAFVRRMPVQTVRGVVAEELVPGGPFPTRPAAGQAGILYARTKTGPHT